MIYKLETMIIIDNILPKMNQPLPQKTRVHGQQFQLQNALGKRETRNLHPPTFQKALALHFQQIHQYQDLKVADHWVPEYKERQLWRKIENVFNVTIYV